MRYVRDKEAVPVDEHGWPMSDCTLFGGEGEQGLAGKYLLTFHGQAEVSSVMGGITFSAVGPGNQPLGNPKNDREPLPRGAGYDPATNTTTLCCTIAGDRSWWYKLTKTARDGKEPKGDGITDIKVMRPITNNSNTNHKPDEIVNRPVKAFLLPYTCLRWLDVANVGCDGLWSSRTPPDFQAFMFRRTPDNNGGECWEMLITLANETGKDLYVALPMLANNEYFEKTNVFYYVYIEMITT